MYKNIYVIIIWFNYAILCKMTTCFTFNNTKNVMFTENPPVFNADSINIFKFRTKKKNPNHNMYHIHGSVRDQSVSASDPCRLIPPPTRAWKLPRRSHVFHSFFVKNALTVLTTLLFSAYIWITLSF